MPLTIMAKCDKSRHVLICGHTRRNAAHDAPGEDGAGEWQLGWEVAQQGGNVLSDDDMEELYDMANEQFQLA